MALRGATTTSPRTDDSTAITAPLSPSHARLTAVSLSDMSLCLSIVVVECDVAVLYRLRHLLTTSAADSEWSARLQRVSELLAQSSLAAPSAAPSNAVSITAPLRSLLVTASAWCIPRAACGSAAVVFSGSNLLAAAHSMVWLAQRSDKQQASRLFAYSTSLDPTDSDGWEGLAASTVAADSQLAIRLQQHNSVIAQHVPC